MDRILINEELCLVSQGVRLWKEVSHNISLDRRLLNNLNVVLRVVSMLRWIEVSCLSCVMLNSGGEFSCS